MGKGNRSRADRADEVIFGTTPAQTKKQKKTNKLTAIVCILVAVLIVFFVFAILCVNNGWLERSKTAISSDNYKISGTMLSYYVYSVYNNNLAANAASYGIDTGKSLSAQSASAMTGMDITWYDYIAASLKEELKQNLAFCEGAKKAGMELGAEEKEALDQSLEALEKAASENLLSANSYCSRLFGSGVRVKDVKKALEIELLAQKYYNSIHDENEADLKKEEAKEELEKYLDEHKKDFLTACTLQYSLKATLTAADAVATETEKAAYAADKAALLDKANAILSAATSEEAFKAAVMEDLCGEKFDEVFAAAYDTAFKSVKDENKPSSDAIDEAKAAILDYCKKVMKEEEVTAPDFATSSSATEFKALRDSVYGTIVTNGFNALDTDVAYSDPTDSSATALAKWLFADGRAANDKEVISDEGDTTSTYTVVYVVEAAKRDETPVRDVAHILVSSSAQAQEILEQFQAGEKTLDAFKALGEGVTEDSSIVYENVYKGQMVEEFNDWLFDENRKEGDSEVVVTDYGNHVMYYIGEGAPFWEYQARETIVANRLTDWCNEAMETYHIKANDKIFVSLG